MLCELAGERVFRRGKEYFDWGQVHYFEAEGDRATALVVGTLAYRVALWQVERKISFDCECPVGQSGRFCKHAVALGLFWSSPEREKAGENSRAHLLEHAINSLIIGGDVSANEPWRERVKSMLDDLLECGLADDALRLIERALGMVAEARRLNPEVNSELSEMEDLLCECHASACRMSGVGAAFAAKRIFNLQLRLIGSGVGQESFVNKLPAHHVDLHGEEWSGAYQGLIEEYWVRLSQIGDERLNLAQRRQYAWLARRMEGRTGRIGGILDHLRYCANETAKPSGRKRQKLCITGKDRDKSELVSIWLEEDDVEAAWEVAILGDCSDDLWLKLAALRVRRHPDESLAVYQRLICRALDRKDAYSARQAVKILGKVSRLMRRLNRDEEFDEFVYDLKKTYGAQRNFRRIINSF